MSDPSVRQLLQHLGSETVPPGNAKQRLGQRARIVQRLEGLDEQLAERDARRSRQRRFVWGALAAAACVVLGVGIRGAMLGPGPAPSMHVSVVDGQVDVGEQTEGVHEDVELSSSDRVKTRARSDARLELDSGADVKLAAASEARFRTEGQREQVELLRGSVSVRVPKLAPGAALGVTTFDTEVEVHGTEFSVVLEEAQGRRFTRVQVSEGTVSVKSGEQELRLSAPSSWVSKSANQRAAQHSAPAPHVPDSLGQAADSPPRASDEAEPISPRAPNSPSKSVPSRGGEPSPMSREQEASKQSTLAEQNALFAEAKAALRGSNPNRGILLMQRFVKRYPGSMHAQSAAVERMRALARLGRRHEAAQAARSYLATYPNGFARAEAQGLAIVDR